MAERKSDPVDEQKRRQQELIEMMRKKQEFESNPEAYNPPAPDEGFVQSRKSKVSNFWYYSKRTIAFVVIVAAILAVGITQCAKRTKYDCTVVMYFKQYIDPTVIDNIGTVMEKYCDDYNGDGEVHVLVMDCGIPDSERLSESGRTKATRLIAQFASEESIIYIVDKGAFDDLSSQADGQFIDSSLELPEFDGRAFCLNGSVFDAAFDTVYEGTSAETDYYIVRRKVDGTAIESKSKVKKYSDEANEIIGKITADPYLRNKVASTANQ